jgi:hypothetical protein
VNLDQLEINVDLPGNTKDASCRGENFIDLI